jgi:hypothetical protein
MERITMDVYYGGDAIRITFDYTPGDKEVTYYGDGSGYPGSAPRVNILFVSGNDFELTIPELEELVFDELEMQGAW